MSILLIGELTLKSQQYSHSPSPSACWMNEAEQHRSEQYKKEQYAKALQQQIMEHKHKKQYEKRKIIQQDIQHERKFYQSINKPNSETAVGNYRRFKTMPTSYKNNSPEPNAQERVIPPNPQLPYSRFALSDPGLRNRMSLPVNYGVAGFHSDIDVASRYLKTNLDNKYKSIMNLIDQSKHLLQVQEQYNQICRRLGKKYTNINQNCEGYALPSTVLFSPYEKVSLCQETHPRRVRFQPEDLRLYSEEKNRGLRAGDEYMQSPQGYYSGVWKPTLNTYNPKNYESEWLRH